MENALSLDEIARFRSDGFVNVSNVCSLQEAAEIRRVLEDLYTRNVGAKQGAQFDVLDPEETNARSLLQLTNPSDFAPAMRKTAFFKKASALARQILGPKAFHSFDLMLMKPALEGAATPWHQDMAYRTLDYDYDEITLWLPLQDVDESNGCLQFVPGSHRGPIGPHQIPASAPNAHSLESCDIPASESIMSVPMRLGDCLIHDGRVLHGSPANRSSARRFAYILAFRNPAVIPATAKPFPWMQQKQHAATRRRDVWLWHGGIIVFAWRKMRRGYFSGFARMLVTFREGISHFQNK